MVERALAPVEVVAGGGGARVLGEPVVRARSDDRGKRGSSQGLGDGLLHRQHPSAAASARAAPPGVAGTEGDSLW